MKSYRGNSEGGRALIALLLVSMLFSFVHVRAQTEAISPTSPTRSPSASPATESAVQDGLKRSASVRESDERGWGTRMQTWLGSEKVSATTTNLLRIFNILAAALIGTLGALAFYAGVKFGFISRDTRKTLLEFLPDSAVGIAVRSRKHFYFMGGIVAAIFQWAQPDVLAPIQAFVLGATWPSVVTRIMSGSTNPVPTMSVEKIDKIIDAAPDTIATTSGKSATDAVVVIGTNK